MGEFMRARFLVLSCVVAILGANGLTIAARAASAEPSDFVAVKPVADPVTLVRLLYNSAASSAAAQSLRARTWKPGTPVRREPKPLWWSYLSRNTKELFRRVRDLQRITGDEYIDADYLCGCQDDEGIFIKSVAVEKSSPMTAVVSVVFSFRSRSSEISRSRIGLVNQGGWKIDDIADGRMGSLKNMLRQSLRGR